MWTSVLAVLAGAVLLFAPATDGKGSGSKPKDPSGTSRDSHDQLRSKKTGQYVEDPRVEADDGPDALRKKFSKLLACAAGEDAHHIIPLSLRTLPAVADAIKAGWDVNGTGNGICLREKITATVIGCTRTS